MKTTKSESPPLRLTLFYKKWGLAILVVAVLSLVGVIPTALAVLGTNRNDVNEWLPAGFQETTDLIWFTERFGSDEILVVSWPGCTLNDPRLPMLVEALGQSTSNSVHAQAKTDARQNKLESSSVLDSAQAEAANISSTKAIETGERSQAELVSAAAEATFPDTSLASDNDETRTGSQEALRDKPLFKQIFHGSDVAEQLFDILGANNGRQTEESLISLDAEVRRRMSGWLLGPDGKTTCAVALISKAGEADRHAAVKAVSQAARVAGIPEEELRVGGPTGDSVAIDIASSEYLLQMTGAACVLSMVLAWFVLRKLSLVLIVFGTALYCELMSLSIMYVTGQYMNSVLIMVPTLIYVLSVSGSIHLVNYYLDACRKGEREAAIGHMIIASRAPCILAALTTAIGVGSLAMSELVPIRKFGIYSAVGTVTALGLLYALLPAALTFLHARKQPRASGLQTPEERKLARNTIAHKLIGLWYRVVIRAHVPIVLLGVLCLGICALGALKIETAVKLKSLFQPSARIIQDYAWLEEQIGPLVPVEIVLAFPTEGDSLGEDRLTLTAKVQERLGEIPGVGGTLSTATFSPLPPSGTDFRATAARTQIRRILLQRREELLRTGYLAEKNEEELWRISARVPAMSDEDYGRYMTEFRGAIESVIEDEKSSADAAASEAKYRISGGVPLFSSASKVLLSDLQSSFFTAFLLIALAMFVLVTLAMARAWAVDGHIPWHSILWRSVCGSVVAMLPNIFPVLLVFGVMGGLGVKVDIGAMMTASVALGIAVDDTLHYLTWFQRSMSLSADRKRAVITAFRHCSVAMIQTSLICSLGLLAFSSSEFIPIARFSWLMCALLFSALLGDMLLLPALLASGFGAVFTKPAKN